MGKSQSRDFDAQIADTTISLISYNMLSIAKRFTSYETIGELFRETSITVLEMTICQRLWGLFLEIISIIAELFDIEPETLMKSVIEADGTKNNKLIKFLDYTMSNAA